LWLFINKGSSPTLNIFTDANRDDSNEHVITKYRKDIQYEFSGRWFIGVYAHKAQTVNASVHFSLLGSTLCEKYETCDLCISDNDCGWCLDVNECKHGELRGPFAGICDTWYYEKCAKSKDDLGSILGIVISVLVVITLAATIIYIIKKKNTKLDIITQDGETSKSLLPDKKTSSFRRTISRVRRKSFGTPDTFDSGFGKGVEEWIDATPVYQANYGTATNESHNNEKS